MQPDELRRNILANPPPRYGDYASVARDLTNGYAPSYEKVKELKEKHKREKVAPKSDPAKPSLTDES